jgi:hypothetical protein
MFLLLMLIWQVFRRLLVLSCYAAAVQVPLQMSRDVLSSSTNTGCSCNSHSSSLEGEYTTACCATCMLGLWR